MLNFRKLKHDFSPAVLKEGKNLYDKEMVVSVKILNLKPDSVRFSCCVKGGFDHLYESELEVDRQESTMIDSDCDCTYKYDCQHLASVLFYLESHFNELLVDYSKETDMESVIAEDDVEREHLLETLKDAESKEHFRIDQKMQKQLLDEYREASQVLGQSSFFRSDQEVVQEQAELAIIFFPPPPNSEDSSIEIQLGLRFSYRSKCLNISQIKMFLDAIRYGEAVYISGKRYFFSIDSFGSFSQKILKTVMDFARVVDNKNDKQQRSAFIDREVFGVLLANAQEEAELLFSSSMVHRQEDTLHLPCLYVNSIEEPLHFSPHPAGIQFDLDYLEVPMPKILLKPKISLFLGSVPYDETVLFECAKPGLIYQNTYHMFSSVVKRKHLRGLSAIRNMTIPEPLFGTFVENSLPELMSFAEIKNKELIEHFVTLPFVSELGAECDIQYLNGELEASLHFLYGNIKISADPAQLTGEQICSFITPEGILARNLTEEQKMIDHLFQNFVFLPVTGVFSTKNEKAIVEFMTETVPAFQGKIQFHCPENLMDQFIYDHSVFKINLGASDRIDMYEVGLVVEGELHGVHLDTLWDCLTSKRAFIELAQPKKREKRKNKEESRSNYKILVLDLEKISPIVHLLDELGIKQLDTHTELRPLWTLAGLDVEHLETLPIEVTISEQLLHVRKQILGEVPHVPQPIPAAIQASFRNYQIEGIEWLDRLRSMYLNGILADDMGLGKTLQAITTLSQYHENKADACSLVVCPTSLVYNWKEEFSKFNAGLRILTVDGNPIHRKKLQSGIHEYDVVVTSYTLLQKDVEFYKSIPFGYVILDEAQNIKNRGTRNAQSVKMIQGMHRLILTGTPIENSLDELWSLFDFLMPGLLSSYDRFVEKYVREPSNQGKKNLDILRKKVAPFILRRMKKDVLPDLPPVSEVVYHCHLSEVQLELYRSYAASAREELSKLVKKEGFDRVQIHVLATLTRLKQICCHPAIFAKDRPEPGDSAKYDLLFDLLQNLIEGKHKTVIFSQYTRMLNIMREDLQKKGIVFEYLDGSSKNRLSIVKKFNEDQNVPIFLVSLKAGGTGLNLVGADTVIHYDMWWNPAVKNQATDRVHRMGQQRSVLSYEFITLNTIEEKILELHKRKNSLVKEVISRDDEMLSKLTWEEILELLQT